MRRLSKTVSLAKKRLNSSNFLNYGFFQKLWVMLPINVILPKTKLPKYHKALTLLQLSWFQIFTAQNKETLQLFASTASASVSLTSRSFLTSQTYLSFTGVPLMLKWAPPGSTCVGVMLIMIWKRQINVACSKLAFYWLLSLFFFTMFSLVLTCWIWTP